jgi:hypothetical protein
MGRLALLGLVSLILFCAPAYAGSVNLIWDYDYTNDTPCQTGQTTNCLSHFIAFHMDGTTRVADKAVTASPTAAGQVTGIQTGFFNTKNLYGTVTYYVVAVARDAAGALVESEDASVAVQLKPSKPKNPRSQSL